MRDNQKLMDDVMALGGNLLGNLLGARHEVRAQAGQHLDQLVARFNLVSRSEFDAAFAMLAKARATQEAILDRLDRIETKIGMVSGTKRNTARKTRLPSVKQGNQTKKRK